MGSGLDMWRVLQVRSANSLISEMLNDRCSELSAPDELIPYLLQAEIASLSPDITAMCIQSATKLFGYWASEAAKQWTDGFIEDLKKAVDIMIEQMEQFASSTHIEVQERVSYVGYQHQ